MKATDDLSAVFALFELNKIISLLIGLLTIVLISKFIKKAAEKSESLFPSYRLLSLQVTTILTFALYIFGTLALIFGVLRPTKELLLALGGSAAVAIGFSLKDLVSSIVAGVTLLFDRPFQVGDRVSYGAIYGEITNIGLRAVRLQTLDDNEVTIPNSKFMSDVVASGNSGETSMMIVTDFHLSMNANIPRAKQMIYEVVATSRFVFLKKPISISLQEVQLGHQLAIKLTVKAYVFDVRYEKEFQTDIFERGTDLLRKNSIGRPHLSFSVEETQDLNRTQD